MKAARSGGYVQAGDKDTKVSAVEGGQSIPDCVLHREERVGGPSPAQALTALFSLTSSRCNIKEGPRVSIRPPEQQRQEIFLPGLNPKTRYKSWFFGWLVGWFAHHPRRPTATHVKYVPLVLGESNMLSLLL